MAVQELFTYMFATSWLTRYIHAQAGPDSTTPSSAHTLFTASLIRMYNPAFPY